MPPVTRHVVPRIVAAALYRSVVYVCVCARLLRAALKVRARLCHVDSANVFVRRRFRETGEEWVLRIDRVDGGRIDCAQGYSQCAEL